MHQNEWEKLKNGYKKQQTKFIAKNYFTKQLTTSDPLTKYTSSLATGKLLKLQLQNDLKNIFQKLRYNNKLINTFFEIIPFSPGASSIGWRCSFSPCLRTSTWSATLPSAAPPFAARLAAWEGREGACKLVWRKELGRNRRKGSPAWTCRLLILYVYGIR